ncbi:hypothetical protein EJF36_10025 [Bacillus sp. HMF5848]|uniref:hypothetical protein n=1 Tax=Bacillus sp. HMF5848 TaxID=2495421 RepID=UPI000F796667|nr:hypothetical protein [Bacillus sp. HMF5848]RSK27188.1 hypothetical protein EJF36_10025 [Bacillus sp. HMF5848]
MLLRYKKYAIFSLPTLVIVPTLFVFSTGLALCSAIAVIGGIIRTFNKDLVQMTIVPGVDIPSILSLPVSIVFAVILLLISFSSWKLLKRYIKFIR